MTSTDLKIDRTVKAIIKAQLFIPFRSVHVYVQSPSSFPSPKQEAIYWRLRWQEIPLNPFQINKILLFCSLTFLMLLAQKKKARLNRKER